MVMVYLSRGVDNKDFGSHWAFYSKRKAWPMEVIRYRHVLEVNPKRLLWKPSRLLFSSHALSHRHSPPASEFLEQTEETTGACHSCLVKMSPASGKDRILQSSIVFYINFYGYTKFSSFCLITVSVRGANLSKFLPSIKPSLWKGGKKKEKKKDWWKSRWSIQRKGPRKEHLKKERFLRRTPLNTKITIASLKAQRETAAISTSWQQPTYAPHSFPITPAWHLDRCAHLLSWKGFCTYQGNLKSKTCCR